MSDELVGHLQACQGECQVMSTLKRTTLRNASKWGEHLPFPWEQSQVVVLWFLTRMKVWDRYTRLFQFNLAYGSQENVSKFYQIQIQWICFILQVVLYIILRDYLSHNHNALHFYDNERTSLSRNAPLLLHPRKCGLNWSRCIFTCSWSLMYVIWSNSCMRGCPIHTFLCEIQILHVSNAHKDLVKNQVELNWDLVQITTCCIIW